MQKQAVIDTKELKETMKKLGLNVFGINKSVGLEAEEFFFSSLSKTMQLGSINFDSATSNFRVRKQGRSQEIDTFLENGNCVAVIEVKHKVKEESLQQLQQIIDNFDFFHPLYKNYQIIPAIAGKIFPENLQNQALKQGFIVLTQPGDHIEQRIPS